MAAAAMTPRSSDTAFMPASLPGVIFTTLFSCGWSGTLSFYYRERAAPRDGGRQRARHDVVDGERGLGRLDVHLPGARGRVPGREQRAAILVGDDRDGIGAQTLGFGGDFVLVHADERPEHRQRHDVVDERHVLERLRRDLADH